MASSSMAPTSSAPQALTTPFVPPETLSCADQFITTSFFTSHNYTSQTLYVQASVPAAPNFAACQPAGWDRNRSTMLQFSPAVCPSKWTAYLLAPSKMQSETSIFFNSTKFETGTTTFTPYKTVTTAYCCSSGFSFNNFIPGYAISELAVWGCVQETNPGETTTTFRVHNPWHISWEASDLASLSPSPPNMGCATTTWTSILDSWVPGSTIDPRFDQGECATSSSTIIPTASSEPSSSTYDPYSTLLYFVAIGIPLFVCAAMFWCISYWRHQRNKRLDKLEATQARNPGVVTSGGETGEENPPPYELVTMNDPTPNDDTHPPPYYRTGGGASGG